MFMTVLTVGILVFVAHLFTALFQKTQIPDVLLLMVLGVIVGPLLHIVEPMDFGKVGPALTTIALIVILFEGGTAMNIPEILKAAGPTLSLTLVTFVATMALGATFLVSVFDVSMLTGLIFGAIIGGTSSAVVIPMVNGLKVREPAKTILVLESSLTDVLCIVVTYALLEATLRVEASTGKVIGSLISSLVFAAVIGIIGGHAWLLILEKVRRFPNTIFTTFAFIFVLYGISEMLGYSGAITSLAYGITLTNFRFFHFNKLPFLRTAQWQSMNDTERIFVGEVVFLLKIFFFVYLGISIQLNNPAFIVLGLLLVLLVYGFRLLITRFVLTREVNVPDAAIASVMVPKGLAAAVLASLPLQYGIAEAETMQDLVNTVILVSIILTAVMVSLMGRLNVYESLFRPFARAPEAESGGGE